MKGCYCLIIEVDRNREIKIGKKLGKITFPKGHYVYVGSAMNSLEARLKRHLRENKKLHWHVDYLLEKSEISRIICNEGKKVECELSGCLCEKANSIRGFGCSDCECESHLYYFENENEAVSNVKKAYESLDINWFEFKK